MTTRAFTLAALVAVATLGACETAKAPLVASGPVTFTRHIAPLLQRHCQECHRPESVAPFPLLTYDDAASRRAKIRKAVTARKMPPWKAVPGYGEFADVRRLSDEEIALVTRWVHDGAPEGDPRDLPPPRKFPTGWALGRPGAVLAMTKPFTIPARTRDIYRCFAVPITIPGEWRFIRASEVLPGNRKVVHHAQPPRPPWTPGFQPLEIPSGVAWGIPPGARLVMQVHYNNPGDAVETDLTRVGLHFTSGPFDRRLNRVRASAWNFSIPAGAPHSSVVATAVVQDELLALSVHGHMHLLGREMRVTARFPDGTRQPLLHIDDWDFEWQLLYAFKRPMALPSGTVIEAECVYDNSADNPNNPSSPPRVVRSGFETTDEMCQANVLGTMRLTRR